MDNMNPSGPTDEWRKCSSCKKPIKFGSSYYVCSVSSCNGQRTGYAFCSVFCFERHLPGARHKDAAAVEKISPDRSEPERPPARVFATTNQQAMKSGVSSVTSGSASAPREVLVIASRLKDYIQARSEFNTSASVMDTLSDHLRVLCDRAIESARAEGRKTVMERDFDFLRQK